MDNDSEYYSSEGNMDEKRPAPKELFDRPSSKVEERKPTNVQKLCSSIVYKQDFSDE